MLLWSSPTSPHLMWEFVTKDRNTRWQSGRDPDNKIIGVELGKEGENIYPKEKAAPIARPSAKLWKASPSTTFDLGLFAKIWFDNVYTMRAEEGIEDSCEVSFWNILYVKGHQPSPTPTWSSSEVATLGQWEVYLGGRSPTLVSVNVVFSSSSKEGMYVNSRRGFSAFLTLPWACPWPNRLITWGLLFEESPNPPFSVSFSFPHFSLCLFRSFANQDFSALFLFSFHS